MVEKESQKRIRTGLFFVTLLIIGLSMPTLYSAYASMSVPGVEKGIVYSASYVVKGMGGAPTFSELKKAGFTFVGTIAYLDWKTKDWNQATKWIKSARDAGFVTFIDFWADANLAVDMAKRAASTGADILAFDEFLTYYHMSQIQLQTIINASLSVNSKLQFILNEPASDQVRNAYEWTAKYPFVRIATDHYYDKTIIDLGIQLSRTYGKKPAAWLIFAGGSESFDCSTHLDDWLTYVKQRQVDTLFWMVDKEGTWPAQWQKVAGF